MKCCTLQHFIWVFTVCQSTPFGVSSIFFVCFGSLQPSKQFFSHIKTVLLGWTSNKQRIKCLFSVNKGIFINLFCKYECADIQELDVLISNILHLLPYFTCFVCFVASHPKSTTMVMEGRSVHLATLFSWESLNKQLTSASCTNFRL